MIPAFESPVRDQVYLDKYTAYFCRFVSTHLPGLSRQVEWVRANLTAIPAHMPRQRGAGDDIAKRTDRAEFAAPASHFAAPVPVHDGPLAAEEFVESLVLLRSISNWLTRTVDTVWISSPLLVPLLALHTSIHLSVQSRMLRVE
jgi:hypothetical protein